MKTIDEEAMEYALREIVIDTNYAQTFAEEVDTCVTDFKAGVEFAQRWLLLNNPKEEGIDYIFKRKDGRCSIGHFEFIGSKLCIVSDIGYSMVEDSEFKYFRPIELK